MKPKTIETICDEVAKEMLGEKFDIDSDHLRIIFKEVCKRYAIEVTKPIIELLAVMHGDGGHYQEKHGLVKAIEDAMELLHTKWKSPDQVRECCKASLGKAKEKLRVWASETRDHDELLYPHEQINEDNIVL